MQGVTSQPICQLTPMIRQYLEVKENCKDAILFFRMGDFYEMFFEDAQIASRLLGLTLTTRDKGDPSAPPMCGIPYHSANNYIAKLIKNGCKVAVCEQIEDPKTAKGIVKREITRVITPGVAFDEELLDAKANNFIASVVYSGEVCGFAYMDATTGDFRVAEFNDIIKLTEEIKRINPMELVIPENAGNSDFWEAISSTWKNRITYIDHLPSSDEAALLLLEHFKVSSMDGFGCTSLIHGLIASAVLLRYVKGAQRSGLVHIKRLSPYYPDQFVVIDSITKRNLELTENMRDGSRKHTLIDFLDRTRTAMGARKIRTWLDCPLLDTVEINKRLDAVSELVRDRGARENIQTILTRVYDMERLAGRITMPIAAPRDLTSLMASLMQIPAIKENLSNFNSPLLKGIHLGLDKVEEVVELIGAAIADNPPNSLKEGGVIKGGYNAELDNLREIRRDSKAWIARLETEERAKTGINSLKVRFNNVFGYYIEITKANLSSVPPHYIRKQTITNAERFITAELKELETKVMTAEDRILSLEHETFNSIRNKAANYVDRIQHTANLLAGLDAVTSLAQIADEMDYAKPAVNTDGVINIVNGRHPVIEAAQTERFVPNDIHIDPDESQILVITGPNMAGKSTYLRQTALITLMAQIGSFVPADNADIGIVDRIFTRVGASDDITSGHSTFMMEMLETANILNNATPRSLIILDEIGRGTSTYDGLSIAWAVVEYIHDNPCIRAKTIFATHYHELTELPLTKERVKNYNIAVREWNDKVIFLRKVVPGGTNRSYGIQVAKLAGFPEEVTARAKEILMNLEKGELDEIGMPRLAASKNMVIKTRQLNLFAEKDPVKEALKAIDPNKLTPIEALLELEKLKELLP